MSGNKYYEQDDSSYNRGRKDNQAKCEVCKREDCLTILCHADLKVFKQDIRKDAIDEILKIIDDTRPPICLDKDIFKGIMIFKTNLSNKIAKEMQE
jgi:hypothetical protein